MKYALLPAALALALIARPAAAQMMLPGAQQAAPEGATTPAKPPPSIAAKPKPAAPRPPGDDSIVDRDLSRNGSEGLIRFRRAPGAGIEITSLSLAGEEITHPGEACRLDIVAGGPIEAKANGKPKGLVRYDVGIEACPFSLDVLDGAVLVTRAEKTCDFAAADCRVDPTGLWGPAASAIDDKQVKQFERARGGAEATMRANFRALLASAGKDKAAVKAIAGEQAGFSSEREVICRNYASEDVHGFCALRLTQARAFALQAKLEASGKRAEPKKAKPPETKTEAKPQSR
ncbi:MAG: hypothetical protein ACLPSF_01390 [Methylocella sp.]